MWSRLGALAARAVTFQGHQPGGQRSAGAATSRGDALDRAAVGAAVVGLVGCLLFAASPHPDRYWASLAAIVGFALAPVAFASARARLETPVCPLNWILALFLFQLVVDPLLIAYGGPFVSTLPFLPGNDAVNVALLVSTVAWAGFVAGCEVAQRWRPGQPRLLRALRDWERPAVAQNRLVAAFALLGLVGLALAFQTPAALLDYFDKAGGHVGGQNSAGQSDPVRAASVVLRSFLAFALIVPWCAWIDRRRPRERLIGRTVLVAALVALASATYSYNRGAVVAPLLAGVGVYGARVLRLRFSLMVLAAILVLGLLTTARAYRNTDLTVSQALTTSSGRDSVLKKVSLSRELQIYTSSPQFLGYLLERTNYGHRLRWGKTLVSSAMYPVPAVGAPFRDSSGVVVYNRLVYGRTGNLDQVVPFQGELFLDFAFPGVVVGYLCLGLLVSALQRAFERTSDAFSAFALQYAAIWLGFLVFGSLAVVTQIAIYFFWPVVIFAALRPDRPSARA